MGFGGPIPGAQCPPLSLPPGLSSVPSEHLLLPSPLPPPLPPPRSGLTSRAARRLHSSLAVRLGLGIFRVNGQGRQDALLPRHLTPTAAEWLTALTPASRLPHRKATSSGSQKAPRPLQTGNQSRRLFLRLAPPPPRNARATSLLRDGNQVAGVSPDSGSPAVRLLRVGGGDGGTGVVPEPAGAGRPPN